MKFKALKRGTTLALLLSGLPLAASAECVYQIDNEWNNGFVASITITNTHSAAVDAWDVAWEFAPGTALSNHWNASLSGSNPYQASNLSWNNSLAPGQSISFGLQGTKSGLSADIPELTGSLCGLGPQNQEPVAEFTLQQSQSDLSFDAGLSSDPDNDPLTYSWTFGDGSQAEGLLVEHSYTQVGSYTVTLTVTDGELSNSVSQVVQVDSVFVNTPPAADLDVITSGLKASLDATDSSDIDGDDLSFTWDLGDGTTAQGERVNHTYPGAGSYTVTLEVSDGEATSILTQELLLTADGGAGHASNPFLGATTYLNPDYAKLVDISIAQETDATTKENMTKVKDIPTAVWLDRIEAIYGGSDNGDRMSLEEHFEAALAQKIDGIPMTITIVVYNLPDRDCAAFASNGTLFSDKDGLNIYKRDYIDVIADIASDARFDDLRIVAVLEPDSLPNLVTNTQILKCGIVNSEGTYVKGIQYALKRFAELDNVYTYLDIAHSGWLGWDSNFKNAVSLYASVVKGVNNGDMSVLDGFVTNVANYTPTEEVHMPDPEYDHDLTYTGLKASKFYEWNPVFDEKDFVEALHEAFVNSGFPDDIAMLIDTSRNGWGGPNRPAGPDTDAVGKDDYVWNSKIDRREHRGNWCNVSGAGVGERPQTLPYGSESVVEAFVWIKPPGESDGTSDSSQTEPDSEGKSFDRMCSPDHITSGGVLTGALDNAPPAGGWFHEQFKMLVENAFPAL